MLMPQSSASPIAGETLIEPLGMVQKMLGMVWPNLGKHVLDGQCLCLWHQFAR